MSATATPATDTDTDTFYLYVALPLCLSWRMWWANRMPIMDCDEVYNYWEPLHFLLYGSGLQTWEYAHEFALRTYAYLLPLAGWSRCLEYLLAMTGTASTRVLALLLMDTTSTVVVQEVVEQVVVAPKFILFLLLRSFLAATMAYAEVQFCRALERTETLSPVAAKWLLVVLQSSAGLAHASGSFLPSTAWTVTWLLAATCLLRGQSKWFVVVAVTATLAIGWPFGVLVLVPLGVHVLLVQTQTMADDDERCCSFGSQSHLQAMKQLVLFIVAVTTVVQDIVLVMDYNHYGIWTSPNWNIFRYNAQGGGDELYGVEPTSYYVKNLLLNFNGVAVLGTLALIALGARRFMLGKHHGDNDKTVILVVLLLPLYLWFAIVVPRPHKEERFLFPIYPILCLGAVVTWDVLVSFLFQILHKKLSSFQPTLTHRSMLHGLAWVPMGALSLLRILALHKYYTAPLSIYAALHVGPTNQQQKRQIVCTCGEWYRFPSSFALPSTHELAFLPSSFTGQLPQPFSPHGSLKESQAVLQPFNDLNRHEPTRYSTLEDCDYVIDLQESIDCQVPSSARVIATAPFLDADKTASTLHRTLYIPWLHEKGVAQGTIHYQNYVLYKLSDG